jgi:hypothetical protein
MVGRVTPCAPTAGRGLPALPPLTPLFIPQRHDRMSATTPSSPPAWEPLTPRGVAAFARAPLGRLLLVQFMMATLAAGVVGWFLAVAWFPVISAAIQKLPAQGEIKNGELNWTNGPPAKLAGNHFLALVVDPAHDGQLTREAQLQVEFGRRDARVSGLAGYAEIPYPAGWIMAFNRTELDPWWAAWEPLLLSGAVVLTVVGLMLSWTLLATLYFVPVKLFAFFENHDLGWWQSWRLAGAALMPGAMFLTGGMVLQCLGIIDLVQLGAVWALHFVIGWLYLFISPLFLPRHPSAKKVKRNPFAKKEK